MLVPSRILLTGGRGTRDASLGRQKWPCHAGAADLQDRFWRDGDLLMLFRHTPQGHSLPRSVPAGYQSGECRMRWPCSCSACRTCALSRTPRSRDALQRINAAQANLEVVASEVLDCFGEALGDAAAIRVAKGIRCSRFARYPS